VTSKPKIKRDLDVVSGLAALALFVVMGAVFFGATFDAPTGFEAGASVTASLGYAMFNITGGFVPIAGEGMLAVFLIIALVLDAALEGSVMLARRDVEDEAAVPDGGTATDPGSTGHESGGDR
jgi:NADH-quinone oxidoreductase subunit J